MQPANLRSRLQWVAAGRLLLTLVLTAGIVVLELLPQRLPEEGPVAGLRYTTAYWILLALFATNLIHLLLLRGGRNLPALGASQLVLDLLLVTLLVYVTGIDRIFAFLYFAIVLVSPHILPPRYALAFASGATILLSTVSLLYFFSAQPDGILLPGVPRETIREHFMRMDSLLPYLASFSISLHVTALLSSLLAREMNRVRMVAGEVLENLAGGVLAADRNGRIGYLNGEARRLLRPARVGDRIDRIPSRELRNALASVVSTGRRIIQEILLADTPYELLVSPIQDPSSSRLRGAVAILTNQTVRRRLQEMEKVHKRFLAFVELSASLAHEIRNPLASIRGASQELSERLSPSPEEARLLGLLVREVDRLDKILTSFIEYAAPRPLELQVCDISKILEETATLLEARRRDGQVELVRRIQPGLIAKADADRLKQVFLNVGINALEACTNGRGRIKIAASRDGSGGAAIEFTDNGEGIPQDVLPKVFDPFFSTKGGGSGMGLAIARHIVQGHGGRIQLDSQPGRGTVCRIWLPL